MRGLPLNHEEPTKIIEHKKIKNKIKGKCKIQGTISKL
jgi:hypothetical protein